MRTDHYFDSCGGGKIHYCRWMPEGEPKAVLQIIHGIAEYVERYDPFAAYLNSLGYLVVAEDHMGHGQSVGENGVQGYFFGGWFAAVEDSCTLMRETMAEFPRLPYVLFGHSMGSFMARTILAKYPDSGITAAVICGTGGQPRAALPGLIQIVEMYCRKHGEDQPSETLQNLVVGVYNRRIPEPRPPYDWLSRDEGVVDAYMADPMCGFTAAAGLLRDMMKGILYVEQPKNLENMKKHLPVLFIAGAEDPVGDYGRGVSHTAKAFKRAGRVNVALKLYLEARHEILNELNRQEIYRDVSNWLENYGIAK